MPVWMRRHPCIPSHRNTLQHLIPTPIAHRRHTRTLCIIPIVTHQKPMIERLIARHTRRAKRRAEHIDGICAWCRRSKEIVVRQVV
jgi:hypothetical protein